MYLAPICLFTYTRLQETQQTVAALQQNNLAYESDLFVFLDGPRREQDVLLVNAVRAYIREIKGFKSVEIIESEQNKGLAASIIAGVTMVLNNHESVIVLEDDLITSPNFLDFMNQALRFYRNEQHIQSISAYSLLLRKNVEPLYFQTRPGSWGWATWKDRWETDIFNTEKIRLSIQKNPKLLTQFKHQCGADMPEMLLDSLNGKNDSWYVRWAFNQFLTKRVTVFPSKSYVQNIGFNDQGTHCKGINPYISEQAGSHITPQEFPDYRLPDQKETAEFLHYFTKRHKLLFRIKLLRSKNGRKQVFNEIKTRFG